MTSTANVSGTAAPTATAAQARDRGCCWECAGDDDEGGAQHDERETGHGAPRCNMNASMRNVYFDAFVHPDHDSGVAKTPAARDAPQRARIAAAIGLVARGHDDRTGAGGTYGR